MSEHLVLLVGMTIFHNFHAGLEDGPSRKYDKGSRRLKAYYETFSKQSKGLPRPSVSLSQEFKGITGSVDIRSC